MPNAGALNTESENVLRDHFSERVFFMIFFDAEADLELSQPLEMLLQPLEYEVAAVVFQGNRQTLCIPLLFLVLPLPDMLFNPLTTCYRTVVIEFLRDPICEEWPRDVNIRNPSSANGL